jgi:hypothetical protein
MKVARSLIREMGLGREGERSGVPRALAAEEPDLHAKRRCSPFTKSGYVVKREDKFLNPHGDAWGGTRLPEPRCSRHSESGCTAKGETVG